MCADVFILFVFAGVSIQLEDVEIQVNSIAGEVDLHDSQIALQEERLDIIEDDVDEWDDKITALEVANDEIVDRLIVVEENILGKINFLRINSQAISFSFTCCKVITYYNALQSRG